MTVQPSSSSGGSSPFLCDDCGCRTFERDIIRNMLVCADCGLQHEDPDQDVVDDNAGMVIGEDRQSEAGGPLGSVIDFKEIYRGKKGSSSAQGSLRGAVRRTNANKNPTHPGERCWKSIKVIIENITGWESKDPRMEQCKMMFFLFRGKEAKSQFQKSSNAHVRHCILAHVYVEEIKRDPRTPKQKTTKEGRQERDVRWATKTESSDVQQIRKDVIDHLGHIEGVTTSMISLEIRRQLNLINQKFSPSKSDRKAVTMETILNEARKQLDLAFDEVRFKVKEVGALPENRRNEIKARLQEILSWVYNLEVYPSSKLASVVNLRKNVHAELIYQVLDSFGIEVSRSAINPVVGARRKDGPSTKDAASIGRLVKAYYAALPAFNAMTEQATANVKDEAIVVDHIRSQAMRGYQLMHQHPDYHRSYGEGASADLNRTHLHCAFLNHLLEEQGHPLDDETRAAIVQDHLEEQDENEEATVDEDDIERFLRYLNYNLNREMET